MDPDSMLGLILRLCDALDAALEAGLSPDENEVYTLVGLVAELDAWMVEGRTPPRRWDSPDRDAAPAALVLAPGAASNDVTPARRRRAPVRRRRGVATGQLALPFHAGAG